MTGGGDGLAFLDHLAADGAHRVAGVAVRGAGGFRGIPDLGLVTGGGDGLGPGLTAAGAGEGLRAVRRAGGRLDLRALVPVVAQGVGVIVLVALALILVAGVQGVALLGAGGGDHRVHVGVGGLCRGQGLAEEHLHRVGGVGGGIVKDAHRHGHIILAQDVGTVSLRAHPQFQEALGRCLALDEGNILTLVGVGAAHRRETAAAVGAGMGKDLCQFPGAGIGGALLRGSAQRGKAACLAFLIGQCQDVRRLDRALGGRLGRRILSAALLLAVTAGLGIGLLLVPHLDGAAARIADGGVRRGGLLRCRNFRPGDRRGLGRGRSFFFGCSAVRCAAGGFGGFGGVGCVLCRIIQGGIRGFGDGIRSGGVILRGLDGHRERCLGPGLGPQSYVGDGADSQQGGGHDGDNRFAIHDFSLFLSAIAGLVFRILTVQIVLRHVTFLLKTMFSM